MFRIFVIVCVSLIFGITAKPWNKLPDEVIQEAVMSVNVEVDSPEVKAEIHNEIDPSMKIWKNMRGTGQNKKYLKAEEDLDELYHPSLDDLPQGGIQNMEVLPVAEFMEKYDNIKKAEDQEISEESQQDWDEFRAREELAEYLAPLAAKNSDDPKIRDDVQVEPLRSQMAAKTKARMYLEPEEDMDDVYHKDPVIDASHQDDIRAAYRVNFPSKKKHTEPEEDLDGLYHRW